MDRLLHAFRDENRSPTFNWDEAYGAGFDGAGFDVVATGAP